MTYKQSLKVVLRGAANEPPFGSTASSSRPSMRLASFVDRESGFPRGWLSAASYRHGQGSWGVHREFDPDPRETSAKKSLRPGATAPLVAIHGTGIVQWVKLMADKKVLDDTDLWLQAIVDGKPAISAPARFWFPHLAGQPNTDSFVMTDRQGPTIRLAMPYAEEIRIEAVNRGGRNIRGVALMVSYQQATQQNRQEIAGRYATAWHLPTTRRVNARVDPPRRLRPLGRLGCGTIEWRAPGHRLPGRGREAAGRLGRAQFRSHVGSQRRVPHVP